MNGKNDGRKRTALVAAEQVAEQTAEHGLEVSHVQPRAHLEPFDLMEREQVACVEAIPPVDATGNDERDRRPALLHRADLHGRRVRS